MKALKKIITGMVVSVMCLSFAGCGGGGASEDKDTITIGVISDSVETGIIDKLKQGFLSKEENKGLKITTVKINTGYDTWVTGRMSAKTVPDMIQVYDYNCEYWTSKGLFASLSDFMQKDGVSASDFSSSVIGLAQSGEDDSYYWLPRDYNKMVVCINTEMFEAAGIEKPSDDWTMTDFYNVCQQLNASADTIKAQTKKTVFYPVEMQLNSPAVYYPFIRAYGGDLFETASDGKISVYKNLDKVKQGVNALLKYADEGLSLPPDTKAVAFRNKEAAMIFTTRPNIQAYAQRLNNKIDFVSMPTIEDVADGEKSYIGMGCTGYAITSNCAEEKREKAWRFLKYVVSEEGQELLGATGSGIPVLNSLLNKKDSAWRSFISDDLNHEAFCKFPERDLIAHDYLKLIPVNKKSTIYETLTTKLLKEIYEQKGADRDDYYISNLQVTLNRNLNQ